jgi:hypothetical protein
MTGAAKRIAVTGLGAVTPAGWGVEAMMAGLEGASLSVLTERREDEGRTEVRVRRVPSADPVPPWFRHPRLRRSSPVARFMAGAGLEALGEARVGAVREGQLRLGIVATMLGACVQYSRRYYSEVLRDPATASPIVFPETVFNAPASHLGAVLGSTGINYTLVGDGAEFLGGLELATEWLLDDAVDGVLVVASEEGDWLSAEAFGLFVPGSVIAEGSGALYLERSESGVELALVTDPQGIGASGGRPGAFRRVLEELPPDDALHLLVEGRGMSAPWKGPRLSPVAQLGDALAASPAWQCVAGCASLQGKACDRASMVAEGMNQGFRAATFGKP